MEPTTAIISAGAPHVMQGTVERRLALPTAAGTLRTVAIGIASGIEES